MPDITMCMNKACGKRYKCYRYMAVPSDWQSYSFFEEECQLNKYEMFWETDGSRETMPMTYIMDREKITIRNV